MNELYQRKRAPFDPVVAAFQPATGGVGASALVTSVGCELARRGKAVVIIDADPGNPAQHLLLSADTPHFAPPRDEDGSVFAFDWDEADDATGRGLPALVTLSDATPSPMLRPEWRASQLMAELYRAPWDYILIDLPPGATPLSSSVFCLVDLPVLVTTTESTSIVGALACLRSSLVYGLLHHPSAMSVERSLVDAVSRVRRDADLSSLEQTFRAPQLRAFLDETRARFQPWLLLNQTRDRAEAESAEALSLALAHLLGVRPRTLPSVPWIADRWLSQRAATEEVAELSGEARDAAATIAAILMRPGAHEELQPRPLFDREATGFDLLGLPADTPTAAARARYRSLWEGFRRSSAMTRVLVDDHLRDGIVRRIEQAGHALGRSSDAPQRKESRTTTLRSAPAEQLEQARRERGISRRELSVSTRVGLRYVEALCEFRVDDLPREVYLRGYLTEVARAVGIHPDDIVDRYVSEVNQHRQQSKLR